MKKNHLKFFLPLWILFAFTIKAQETYSFYYEDFNNQFNRGYKIFVVEDGQEGVENPKLVAFGVNSIVTNATSENNTFDESSRPTHRIPQGDLRGTSDNGNKQKGFQLKGIIGGGSDIENVATESWAFMNPQDLSAKSSPKVSFWTEQRYSSGGNAVLTVWVSQDYDYTAGGDPNAATWTNETSNISGKLATSGVDNITYVFGALDLSAYTSTNVTVAFKLVSTDTQAFANGTKNGVFNVSDVKFEAQTTDVAIGLVSENESVSGQTDVFETPTPAISVDNFNSEDSGLWSKIFETGATRGPRFAKEATAETGSTGGILAPAGEGYKFKVADNYSPVKLASAGFRNNLFIWGYTDTYVSNANDATNTNTSVSKWKLQGSNDDSTWVDLSDPITMTNDNAKDKPMATITLNANAATAYRYFQFVLAEAFRAKNTWGALFEMEFIVGDVTLSANVFEKSSLYSVYPNPVSETLFIQGVEAVTSVQLFDSKGALVMEQDNVTSIDVSSLKSGVYVLRITTANGSVETKKVLVN